LESPSGRLTAISSRQRLQRKKQQSDSKRRSSRKPTKLQQAKEEREGVKQKQQQTKGQSAGLARTAMAQVCNDVVYGSIVIVA